MHAINKFSADPYILKREAIQDLTFTMCPLFFAEVLLRKTTCLGKNRKLGPRKTQAITLP